MTILARYHDFEVEITGTLKTGDGRVLAAVRAIIGKPFTVQTHGGPADTDSALVSPDLLTEVHQVPQPEPAAQPRKVRKTCLAGDPRPLVYEWAAEWLEGAASLFPSKYNADRAARSSRGGMNND
jgi:hypothetical protein